MNSAVQMAPLLSVVVPVFNGMPYLVRCIDSIRETLSQLAPPDCGRIEVVLSDNWSTDDTRKQFESAAFKCSSRIVSPKVHLGRTAHWAYALGEARGTWLMMLHADDWLSEGALPAIVAAALRADRCNAVMISGRHREMAADESVASQRPKWPLPAILSGNRLRRYVLPVLCPFVPFSPFRRSAYLAVGGLNSEFELVQDWELWIRLLAKGDVLYVPDVLGSWHTHAISGRYARTFAAEHIEVAARLSALIPRIPEAAKRRAEDAQRCRAEIWLSSGQDTSRAERTLRQLIRQATLWLTLERAVGTARMLAR